MVDGGEGYTSEDFDFYCLSYDSARLVSRSTCCALAGDDDHRDALIQQARSYDLSIY